jgi:hypothetical protein
MQGRTLCVSFHLVSGLVVFSQPYLLGERLMVVHDIHDLLGTEKPGRIKLNSEVSPVL